MPEEKEFQDWYRKYANEFNMAPNPDDPGHYYDYRKAFKEGASPDPTGHWPSAFKLEGHPNLYINGIDTRSGMPKGWYPGWRDLIEGLREDFPKDYTYEEREPGIYKGSTDIAEVLRDMIPFSSLLTKGFTPETLQDSIMEMIPAPPAAIMAVKGKKIASTGIDKIAKELGDLVKSKTSKRSEWPITLVKRERATMPMGITLDRFSENAAIARAKEGVASPPASTYISEQLKGKIKEKGYVPEVQREIVESFATTPDRKALTLKAIDDFMKVQNEFGKEMKGGRMYLGGSFTSAKPNPEDLDLIVRFPEKLYNTNRSAYDELTNDIGTLANFYASKKSPIHFVLSENLRHLDKFRDVGKLRYGPDYTWQRVLGLGALGLPAISYFGSENDGK